MTKCFHCGLPASPEFRATVNNTPRDFCCVGCQAVTQAIYAGGLSAFYEYRDTLNPKAETQETSFAAYDLPEVQEEFVHKLNENQLETQLNIGGITCAACAWLIENHLQRLEGIDTVSVNVSSHRCRIVWQNSTLQLSEIFSNLAKIGYQPSPASMGANQAFRKNESRLALMRLGVAGVGMMQVGMVAVALHAGDIQGIDDHWKQFLRWVSLIFATPVMLFSARPFFSSAYRSLKMRHLNMDVPVSIALILAFTASIWATVRGVGEVYFDSVSMFTFFLLLGRFLEMRARHVGAFESEQLSELLPRTAEKLVAEQRQMVPIKSLKEGDVLWIRPGSVIPCDGAVLNGESTVDESMLTGESLGVAKSAGSYVSAGTVNGEQALTVQVEKLGQQTNLATIERLVDQASTQKPSYVAFADKIAGKFVAAVLLISIVVFSAWLWIDASQAVWVVLSVLVVTCPCALSLATPAALTAGTNFLRKKGLLIRAGHVLETLPKINELVFDKTGTLTLGKLKLAEVRVLSKKHSIESVKQTIAALEAHSAHPIANAFKHVEVPESAQGVEVSTAMGVQGRLHNQMFRFGKLAFIQELSPVFAALRYPGEGLWQVLATKDELVAWVRLNDAPRKNIPALLHDMHTRGVGVSILSGDRKNNVEQFAQEHNISNLKYEALPEDKLAYIERAQQNNKCVVMVGDGINDVPVLSRADIAIAMGEATQLARAKSDCVLLNDDLRVISDAVKVSEKVKRIIRQNLAWAIGYNLIALPAAALGFIPPYLAAIGMSLSSLVVVLNALRLNFKRSNKSERVTS